MFENVGGGEVLLILLVVLVFFGPKKIPELAQSLGKGLRKFNEAKEGLEAQVKTAMKEPLEAIAGTKSDLEARLREAAEPLHAELKLPAPKQETAPPPPMPAPAETFARGAHVDAEPEATAAPKAEASTATPAAEPEASSSAPAASAPTSQHVPAREA